MTKKELAIIDGVRLERDRLDALLAESKQREASSAADLKLACADVKGLQKESDRLAAQLNEVHIDGNGTAWTRPTAWAYMQACKARDKHEARVKTLEAALRLVVDMNDCGASYVAKKALAAKEPKALLRPVNDKLPDGCHCSPGNCMAPVIMGFQTPCRDPQKAAGERK